MDLNSVSLTGRLTRDVELKYLANGTPLASFGVAMNGGKDKSLFVDCSAFGKTAEIVQQYFRKGTRIALNGRLNFESWTSVEGHKRSKVSVVANSVLNLDPRQQQQDSQSNQQHPSDITGGNESDHPF